MGLFGPKTVWIAPAGGATHHHTHVEMVDPSIEKGARFLSEVQAEAAKRVVSTVLVDVPSIDAKLVLFEQEVEVASGDLLQLVTFKINGHEIAERIRVDRATTKRAASVEIIEDDENLSDALHAELKKQRAFSLEHHGTIALATHPFGAIVRDAIFDAALTPTPEGERK